MYTRKLVKSGLSSNVIALPKEYIEDNDLKTGDTVYVDRQGKRQLVISPVTSVHTKKENAPKVKTIEVGKRPLHHVERDIIEAYLKNYNEIIIEMNSASEAKIIKQYIGYLVAFEVVQEDTKRIIAKDFLNYGDRDVERGLRRIEHVVGSMLSDLNDVENDKSVAEAIIERDREVNRMGFLIMRILQVAAVDPRVAEMLGVDSLLIIRLWSVNIHLEKIGDETKRIGRSLARLSFSRKKRTIYNILDPIITLYRNTFIAMHSDNRALLDTNMDTRERFIKTIDEYAETKEGKELADVVSLLRQILSHIGDINRVKRYVGE